MKVGRLLKDKDLLYKFFEQVIFIYIGPFVRSKRHSVVVHGHSILVVHSVMFERCYHKSTLQQSSF